MCRDGVSRMMSGVSLLCAFNGDPIFALRSKTGKHERNLHAGRRRKDMSEDSTYDIVVRSLDTTEALRKWCAGVGPDRRRRNDDHVNASSGANRNHRSHWPAVESPLCNAKACRAGIHFVLHGSARATTASTEY